MVEAAPQPAGTLSAQGVAFSHSSDVATVALAAEAALAPAGELIAAPLSKALPPPPTAVALTPAPTPPPEIPLLPVKPPAVEAVPPAAAPPARLLVEDPRYPSVILLPPPNTGDNSSIITLKPGG
jgi:hypothetical protein